MEFMAYGVLFPRMSGNREQMLSTATRVMTSLQEAGVAEEGLSLAAKVIRNESIFSGLQKPSW